jgi:hypothetical protein
MQRTCYFKAMLVMMALLAPGALALAETGGLSARPLAEQCNPQPALPCTCNHPLNQQPYNDACIYTSMLYMATGVGLPMAPSAASGRQLKQQIGCFDCGNNNGNNNGAIVGVSQTTTQTNQQGGGGGNPFPISFPITFPLPVRGHRRMLKQQIGCFNCGSNNGNNNGAIVDVSQTTTQTNRGGGGGGGQPLIPFIPFIGHKRMLKQCVDNFESCQSWGRTQCDRPGVADRCPCMCTGSGAPGTQPVGPPVIQQVGCFNCGNGNGNGNGK